MQSTLQYTATMNRKDSFSMIDGCEVSFGAAKNAQACSPRLLFMTTPQPLTSAPDIQTRRHHDNMGMLNETRLQMNQQPLPRFPRLLHRSGPPREVAQAPFISTPSSMPTPALTPSRSSTVSSAQPPASISITSPAGVDRICDFCETNMDASADMDPALLMPALGPAPEQRSRPATPPPPLIASVSLSNDSPQHPSPVFTSSYSSPSSTPTVSFQQCQESAPMPRSNRLHGNASIQYPTQIVAPVALYPRNGATPAPASSSSLSVSTSMSYHPHHRQTSYEYRHPAGLHKSSRTSTASHNNGAAVKVQTVRPAPPLPMFAPIPSAHPVEPLSTASYRTERKLQPKDVPILKLSMRPTAFPLCDYNGSASLSAVRYGYDCCRGDLHRSLHGHLYSHSDSQGITSTMAQSFEDLPPAVFMPTL